MPILVFHFRTFPFATSIAVGARVSRLPASMVRAFVFKETL